MYLRSPQHSSSTGPPALCLPNQQSHLAPKGSADCSLLLPRSVFRLTGTFPRAAAGARRCSHCPPAPAWGTAGMQSSGCRRQSSSSGEGILLQQVSKIRFAVLCLGDWTVLMPQQEVSRLLSFSSVSAFSISPLLCLWVFGCFFDKGSNYCRH